jgi:hypothetical protein
MVPQWIRQLDDRAGLDPSAFSQFLARRGERPLNGLLGLISDLIRISTSAPATTSRVNARSPVANSVVAATLAGN